MRPYVEDLQHLCADLKKPSVFLEKNDRRIAGFKQNLKDLYDFVKSKEQVYYQEPGATSSNKSQVALPELLIRSFELEQIWQQLQLQNEESLRRLRVCCRRADQDIQLCASTKRKQKLDTAAPNAHQADGGDEDISMESGDEELSPSLPFAKLSVAPASGEAASTEADDRFFKATEMEGFCEHLERQQDGGPVPGLGELNLFSADSDIESDGNEEEDQPTGYLFKDFFDPPSSGAVSDGPSAKKKVHFSQQFEDANHDDEQAEEAEASTSGEVEGPVSSFEKRQHKLKERIAEVEDKSLSDKPWHLKGEVSARDRPENSLLEEYLQFDYMTKTAPVVTAEVTAKLEDVIMQRIKDKAWDDVERKVKPYLDPAKYKQEMILDQQKSKQSLSQLYEQEFLKQTQGTEEEKANPEHQDIRDRMKELFYKLDALSNYHYTPKEPVPEVKVVKNMPSIAMEEVAPVTASDATLLAPAEIKTPVRHEPVAKDEQSETDKKRERRLKKKNQQSRFKRQREKEERVVGKDTKKRLEKIGKVKIVKQSDEKRFKTSKSVFAKLDSNKSDVKKTGKKDRSSALKTKRKLTGAHYKL